MKNATNLIDTAALLSLSVEVSRGRIRIEGPAAEVKRAFVMQGYDAKTEGTTGWSMWESGRLTATICRMPSATDYAYGYTVIA